MCILRKILKKKDVTVDHIISIRKAQKSKILQFILRLVKINDINDEKNLTTSCETCNKKKGQKLSLSYVLREFSVESRGIGLSII